MLFCLTEASLEIIKGSEAYPRLNPLTIVSQIHNVQENDAPKNKYTMALGPIVATWQAQNIIVLMLRNLEVIYNIFL